MGSASPGFEPSVAYLVEHTAAVDSRSGRRGRLQGLFDPGRLEGDLGGSPHGSRLLPSARLRLSLIAHRELSDALHGADGTSCSKFEMLGRTDKARRRWGGHRLNGGKCKCKCKRAAGTVRVPKRCWAGSNT